MGTRISTYLMLLLLFAGSLLYASETPRAEKGVLDLRSWDLALEKPLEIKGEFEFFWNQMLSPGIEPDLTDMTYIQVPGSWMQLHREHPGIERYGYATYRLKILLPPGTRRLSFHVHGIFSASAFFLDGKAISYIGFPGTNEYQQVPSTQKPVILGSVSGDETELVIKVSNFGNVQGGIVDPILIGSPEQIMSMSSNELNQAFFLIGAFLMIGFYFLGLFVIRTEEYRLYFAIICFLMALRVVFITDIPLLEDMNISYQLMTKLSYLNVYLFAPAFTMMLFSLFPLEFPRWALKIVLWSSLAFVLLVIVAPVSLFSLSYPIFFVFYLLICLLILYVILLAWVRGRSHAPAYTIGLLIVFAGSLNDMLNEVDVIDTGYFVHYTMFIYLLIYAYIFADKSNYIQRKSDQLARELSSVKNNLEQLVEERTTELKSLSKQLERQKEKLEVTNRDLVGAVSGRNQLLAIIGHDVKAPIGYNMQALELLIEDNDLSVEQRHELLKMMASSAEATYNLLDNLLVWGRSQTGKLKSNPIKVRLKDLINESLDLVNIGLREKHLTIEDFVKEEHVVVVDRDQLFIVVRNLINNAMKFTPEGGRIILSSKARKGEVLFTVSDTGIGIPEDTIAKILEGKSKVSTNGTKGEKGSGLGLRISKDILASNNGWLDIESKTGEGTSMTVGLKAAKKKSERKVRSMPAVKPAAKSAKKPPKNKS